MRKLFAGLGAALAVLIMALAMAPPKAHAVAISQQGQIALVIDNASPPGQPGGAAIAFTDISYTDQLGAIALADSIDPMGSVALDTQAVGVATARSDDWSEEAQGSAPALLASSMASAGIRKLGGSSSGGTGRETAHQDTPHVIAMVAGSGTTFSQYTAQDSA